MNHKVHHHHHHIEGRHMGGGGSGGGGSGMSDSEVNQEAKPEVKPEVKPETHINLKVSDGSSEIFFKIKKTTPLRRLMEAFAKRQGKEMDSLRFLYDGIRIQADQTPEDLDMEDNDIIEAHREQIGGTSELGTLEGSPAPDAVAKKCPFKSRFYYDNRFCTCNRETDEIQCQDRANEYKDELQVTQLQSVHVTCEPASVFDLDCSHTCVCDAEGSSALCAYSFKKCTEDQAKALLNQCTPGSILNDDCNTCVCDESGKPVCTKLDCDLAYGGENPNGEVVCVPDTSYVLQCNDCECSPDGLEWECNKMGCGPYYSVYHESLTNVTTTCEPKEKYESGCQECYCGNSGNYALCVGIECDENSEPKNTIEKCLPGSIVTKDCNSCVCNDDGKAVCTQLPCDLKFNKV